MAANKNSPVQNAVDITIKLGALLLLLVWCFQIILPFANIVFWALIIAITILPLYKAVCKKMKNEKKIAAIVIVFISLAIIIIPSIVFTDSLVTGIQAYSKDLSAEDLKVPPPDKEIKEWPLIGNSVYNIWSGAHKNLEATLQSYSTQLKSVGSWFINALMGTGMAFIQFIISIIIAGIFLAYSEEGGKMLKRLFRKLVDDKGDEYANIAELTVRNVSKGVLGVAFIQSFLAGLVFLMAGIPYAGLWALLCLILSIIQIGPAPVIIPVIVYLFTISETWIAILWTIALVLVMISDNIMKPLLMGKGAPVPTLVIFLGSIGGFIASGFMGLFLGAIVLSLGYKLFIAWVNESNEDLTVNEI
ncbi:MAG: AI-2E family transporter [Bacteroidales bacterium]